MHTPYDPYQLAAMEHRQRLKENELDRAHHTTASPPQVRRFRRNRRAS